MVIAGGDYLTNIREESELKNFCIKGDLYEVEVQHGVKCIRMPTKGFSLISMLFERGTFSGQLYQPPVNNRVLDIDQILNDQMKDGKFQRAVYKAQINPENDELFTAATPLSLFMYEVVDANEDAVSNMRSMVKFATSNENGRGVNLHSYIMNKRAVSVSGVQFKRLLELFGHRWVDEKGTVREDNAFPEAHDVAGFCALFKNSNVMSKEGFEKFLQDFKLKELFDDDGMLSHPARLCLFSKWIRSIVGVRFAGFDSQHRIFTMAMAVEGHLMPSDKPNIKKYSKPMCILPKDWENMQVWTQLNLSIGKPLVMSEKKEVGWEEGLKVMQVYGELMNMNAEKLVATNPKYYVEELLKEMDRACGQVGGPPLELFGFSQYWSASKESAWKIVQKPFLDHLVKFFLEKVDKRNENGVFAGEANETYMKARVKVEKTFGASPDWMAGRQDEMPRQFGSFLQVIKFCAMSGVHRASVMRLWGNRESERQLNSDQKVRVKSLDWIKLFVLDPLQCIGKLVMQKVMVERAFIKFFRSKQCTDEFKTKLSERTFIGLKMPGLEGLLAEAQQDNPGKVKTSSLGPYKSKETGSMFHKKVVFAILHALFFDIVDTINKYGHNPALEPDATKNKLLRDYLG